MIRFVNIKDQITEGAIEFAWYDTVTDRFISFDDRQVFESWDDFVDCFNVEINNDYPLKRFEGLFQSST